MELLETSMLKTLTAKEKTKVVVLTEFSAILSAFPMTDSKPRGLLMRQQINMHELESHQEADKRYCPTA